MTTKRKKKPMQFRQGDVLVMKDDAAAGKEEIARDDGAVVLAYGEITGHRHQIRAPGVCHLRAEGIHAAAVSTVTALLVEQDGAELVHEEHSTIVLPAGRYHVVQQSEYTPEEYRNVQD